MSYDAFLAGADLATWRACMIEAAAEAERHPSPATLAEALCVTLYVEWLGRVSGARDAHAEAQARYAELGQTLERVTRGADRRRYNVAWGLVLAWSGYQQHAEELLTVDGRIAPEHRLLVLGDDAVKAMAALRSVATDPAATRFLPVLWQYAQGLVNIGDVHQARDFIASTGAEAHPLLLEVQALAAERLGQWPQARDAYSRSDWPSHRYRAAMTGAILGAGDTFAIDGSTRKFLEELEGELDQAEITRCSAFIDACVWQPVDDWTVWLELGKLSVRRRRHAEADVHLARALRDAPAAAAFAIRRLKFTNLTWLTGDTARTALLPEAIREGYAALECSEPSDDTAGDRIWLQQETGDETLIPADLSEWSAYDRASAYRALGQVGPAVDGWLESLREAYYHRAVTGLLPALAEAGMRETVRQLAALVLRESANNFFALYETAQTLQRIPADEGEPAPDTDQRVEERFVERLVELSQFDFKNMIRAFDVVWTADYQDLAEEFMLGAAKQADGVHDLLALATLRRRFLVQVDEEGLRMLDKALGEARNRLERLQLGRELCAYGSLEEARRLLIDEERVLSADPALEPAETVVLLGCTAALNADEYAALVRDGTRRLLADHAAGALGPRPALFADRFLREIADDALVERARTELGPLLAASGSSVLSLAPASPLGAEIVALAMDADSAPDALRAVTRRLVDEQSIGSRITAIARLREAIAELQADARRYRPVLAAELVPLSEGDARGENDRAFELGHLWRARLTAPDDPTAIRRLRAFYDEEIAIAEAWGRARAHALLPNAQALAKLLEALVELLEAPLPRKLFDSGHPILEAVLERLNEDCAVLREEARAQLRAASAEIAAVPAGAEP